MLFNIIIFSKNRASQLDLLLRSVECYANWVLLQKLTVIYRADEPYSESYNKLKETYPMAQWVEEDSTAVFKELVLGSIDGTIPYTMFLVDDNVFVGESTVITDGSLEKFSNDLSVCTVSQRLWSGINYCYAINQPTPLPVTYQVDERVWNWRGEPGDWGYPYSLDGNIFRTSQIYEQIKSIEFTGPNLLEGYIGCNWQIPGELMLCSKSPTVMNNPCNKVQGVFPNRSGNVDPMEVELGFQSGKRLSLRPFTGLIYNAVHTEVPLVWETMC